MRRSLASLFLGMAGICLSHSAEPEVQNGTFLPHSRLATAELLARGKIVYRNHCAGCHGERGDGLGPGAYGLHPKPRDFTTGDYKFRSTPQGALPTEEDLFRTVQQGLPGTSMPGFNLMAQRDILAVVQYLKTFSSAWLQPENYAHPIGIPAPPSWVSEESRREERVGKGRALFLASCAPCHGNLGDGRSLAAQTMMDIWGNPVRPADLRRPFIRSGRNLSDIFKVLSTGVNGAPMPSFIESTTEEERWELVLFVDQLRREHSGAGPFLLGELEAVSSSATPGADFSLDYE